MRRTATAVLLLFVASCSPKPATPPAAGPRPVVAARAVSAEVPVYLDRIGKALAIETVTVLPQVSGPVVGIHFKDGADVRKGDLLYTIDPRPFEADLKRATAMLEQAKAKAGYDESQRQRNETLRQKGVAAAEELDNARSTAAGSLATVDASEAQVDTVRLQLDYCTIRSPIDGRAGDHQVDIGNLVTANATPLVTIRRQDPIHVEFSIPETDLPRVRHYMDLGGLKVETGTTGDAGAAKKSGPVEFVDSGVDAASGTLRMRATLDNADRALMPGQFVNVRLILGMIPDAVLVPAEAVQSGVKGPFVFVIGADDTVSVRPITPGQLQGDQIVISSGLKAGDVVVVTGQLMLAPGMKVAVKNRDALQ